MITAAPIDAGTILQVRDSGVPGMDRGRYSQVDCEESVLESRGYERLNAINRAVMNAGSARLRPWPAPVRAQAPIDRSAATEEFRLALYQRCGVLGRWEEVPEGRAEWRGHNRPLDRNQWRTAAALTPAEIRDTEAAAPTDWVRLALENEPGLGPGMEIAWLGLQGARFQLAMADNHYWTPFDFRRAAWYSWVGDDGVHADRPPWPAAIGDRWRIALYLRPRRWRWIARVIAHYILATPFESARNDEVFVKVWFDRPPFFPVRHELPRAVGNRAIFHAYEGTYLDYDRGVDMQWRRSRAFRDLGMEMLQQQYFSLCVAYIFESAEPAAIAIQRMPPRVGEIVAGIGIRDQSSGVERRVWARQEVDVEAQYPRQTISTFWADFWV